MIPPHSLSTANLRTYQTIFQHPVSHNLGWLDVLALLRHLGHVEEEANGKFRVSRNGHIMILPQPRTKDVEEVEDVMKLRHFLQHSENSTPSGGTTISRWLLVLNHHEARIFSSDAPGTVAAHVLPHDPDDHFRHAPHSKEFSRGMEKPEPNSFFEPVAQALKTAGQLLIFGGGTGMASEMEQFVSWVKVHHLELARRITGSLTIDEHHLTDEQLLAKARGFYALPLKPAF